MIDIQNIGHLPSLSEISEYTANPVFDQFCSFMEEKYKALHKIEYSKDVYARGWNIKFKKAGKSLCVIYPKAGSFTVLVVVGQKEKDRAEALLPKLSAEMQKIYHETKEGSGQRWLMIDIHSDHTLVQDTLTLIRIRRESRQTNTDFS